MKTPTIKIIGILVTLVLVTLAMVYVYFQSKGLGADMATVTIEIVAIAISYKYLNEIFTDCYSVGYTRGRFELTNKFKNNEITL